MNSSGFIAIIVIALIYLWYVVIIKKKNQALEALSGIDVQLTKRSNLIPNILQIAKSFMKHERDLITEVTALRNMAPKNPKPENKENLTEYFKIHEEITQKMSNLLLQVENYPDLKSNEAMLQAQRTYNEVEANIGAARRFYNSAVTSLNNSIQIFPGNLIAKLANANIMPFYQASNLEKRTIDAQEILD